MDNMQLAAFNDYRVGLVENDSILDVTSVLPQSMSEFPSYRMNWLIEHFGSLSARIESARRKAKPIPLQEVKLLPPSPRPSHIFAAPANYRKHIGELGSRAVTKGKSAREQGFFLKAPGSLVGGSGSIVLPRGSTRRFDHESELAVIIGRRTRNVSQAQAMAHVFGYTCLIDVTMRIERGEAEEERSMRKSFETFTPLGPLIVTADEVGDPGSLANRLWVNGNLRQEANTQDMIVGVAELIELIASVIELRPGDIIATGTPEGVGPLQPGDNVRIALDRVGDMTLPVTETERAPFRLF